MQLTYIGVLAVIVALWGAKTSLLSAWTATALLMVFGASAAISLPALGGSSIPPAYFALGILAAKFFRSPLGRPAMVTEALRRHFWLPAFVGYGVVGAFVLPRLFYGGMEVPPPKGLTTVIYQVTTLQPSAQNITQSFYLLGDAIALPITMIIAARTRDLSKLLTPFLVLSWLEVGFGVTDLALNAIHRSDLMDIIRNGGYAQLDQDMGIAHRISGSFSEPSGFALFGAPLLAFNLELWLRDVRPRASGPAAAALLLILTLSTSTTAYAGIAACAVAVPIRLLLSPSPRTLRKLAILLGASLIVFAAAYFWFETHPDLRAQLTNVLSAVTTEKATTDSGRQRAFWAQTGLEAFKFSHGFGIGVGSFRSGTLVTAIAGSMGAFGCISFVLFLLGVLVPFRAATWKFEGDVRARIAGAAAWGAILGLTPMLVGAGYPDPGLPFILLCGIAAGLRSAPVAQSAAGGWRKRAASLDHRGLARQLLAGPQQHEQRTLHIDMDQHAEDRRPGQPSDHESQDSGCVMQMQPGGEQSQHRQVEPVREID